MPTATKTAQIQQLQETIDGAAGLFLADFTGLNVAQITDLRRRCREQGVTFQVIKNTLALKATRALELDELEPHFRGPTALAVSVEDPTSPARILIDFQKEHERPEVKLGFVEGRVLDAAEVKALASLPTRDQLISQVMQLAQGPAQGVVYVLNGLLSQVVRTVDAVRDGMEKGTVEGKKTGAEAGEKSGEAPTGDAPADENEEQKDQSEEPKDE